MTTAAPWRRRGILAGVSLLTAGLIAYAFAPASVLGLFMADFGIDKPAASAAISAVFLTWALLQVPAGYVLDRYDNRRLVVLGSLAFLGAAVVGAGIGSYPLFLATRLLSGASLALIFVGSVNVLVSVLPQERRAIGLSVFIASPPVGIAIAQFAGPLIALRLGWRAALLAYTALAGVGLVVLAACADRPVAAGGRITVGQFLATLAKPSVLLVSIASFCSYATWTFLNAWMPTYGNEVLGIELAAAGAAAALVPIAGILARPAGGWLSGRIGGRIRPIIAASFVGSIPLLFGLSRAPSPAAFAALLALTGATMNLGIGLYLVSVDRLSQAATRGTSLSVLVTTSNVGNIAAPVVGGWIIVRFSWTVGFGFAIALAVLGLAMLAVLTLTE